MRLMQLLFVLTLAFAVPLGLHADGDSKDPKEPEVDPAKVEALVTQLGARKYAVREAATAALRKLGEAAVPSLKKALKSDDPEVVQRATTLLEQINADLAEKNARKLVGKPAEALKAYGGDAKTEAAVVRALAWLARNQKAHGKWAGADHGAKMGWVDPGLTGMALLAFVSRGETPSGKGPHAQVVKKAATYLMKIQAADGLIGGKRGHYMYNHAVATLAMVELARRTKDNPAITASAKRAAKWLAAARNPGMAWRYAARDGDNDVSVTSWCVTAIHAARAGKLIDEKVGKSALKDSMTYLEGVTDDSYYITGYKSRPPRGWQMATSSRFMNAAMGVNTANSHTANHTPTAIAGYLRVLGGYKANDPRLRGAANAVASQLPAWVEGGRSKVDLYYWFYGTNLMFQMGGTYWKRWNASMKTALLAKQEQAGDARGSWPPVGAWGFAGGRVYSTAMGALTLQSYYRQPRYLAIGEEKK